MTGIPIELFIGGLIMGASHCMLSCAPILLFYVAGTKENWKEALKATLVFSFSRLFAYILLGTIAGFLGMLITDFLNNFNISIYIWIGAGFFILIIGILIILGKEPHLHFCRLLSKHLVKESTISMAVLGFSISLASYCAPMIGILTYIAFNVKNPLTGAFYAFCFGLGSTVITPVIIVGLLAGIFPKLIFKTPKFLMIFRRLCGVIFLFLGGRIIFNYLRIIW